MCGHRWWRACTLGSGERPDAPEAAKRIAQGGSSAIELAACADGCSAPQRRTASHGERALRPRPRRAGEGLKDPETPRLFPFNLVNKQDGPPIYNIMVEGFKGRLHIPSSYLWDPTHFLDSFNMRAAAHPLHDKAGERQHTLPNSLDFSSMASRPPCTTFAVSVLGPLPLRLVFVSLPLSCSASPWARAAGAHSSTGAVLPPPARMGAGQEAPKPHATPVCTDGTAPGRRAFTLRHCLRLPLPAVAHRSPLCPPVAG